MASIYYIKAYYTKPNQQQEIRRFAVDISSENDVFSELKTKIAGLVSDSQLENFVLQYNDEDNERITFSSNDELRSAIALNKEANTLKVFVIFKESITQQQQQERSEPQQNTTNKECHPGVRCDNCQNSVIGFRFKCFVCPDYDLCETCSSAGIHSEHNMIKITKPSTLYLPNDHYYHHYQHHQRHHHPHMPPPSSFPPPPTPPPFVPSQDYLEKIQAQIPQWLPNRQNTAHIRTHIQEHLNSLKANTQAHVQNSKQYLENVGQYLQQVLTPFGIDCEYHVDEQNSSTKQEMENETPKTSEEQPEQNSTINVASIPEPDAVSETSNLTQLDTNNNTNQEQTTSVEIPLIQDSTPITNPLEKAVDDCLERMMSMGFVDTNGVLRELIRSKQGDINSVLDAINPRRV